MYHEVKGNLLTQTPGLFQAKQLYPYAAQPFLPSGALSTCRSFNFCQPQFIVKLEINTKLIKDSRRMRIPEMVVASGSSVCGQPVSYLLQAKRFTVEANFQNFGCKALSRRSYSNSSTKPMHRADFMFRMTKNAGISSEVQVDLTPYYIIIRSNCTYNFANERTPHRAERTV